MTSIKDQLIAQSGGKAPQGPRRTRAEKSDVLSRYPGKGSKADRMKAKKRKIAEASRRRNRR